MPAWCAARGRLGFARALRRFARARTRALRRFARALHLALLAAAAVAALLPARAAAERRALGQPLQIDGVAAFVGGTTPGEGVLIILRSDVELRARLSLLAGGIADAAHAVLAAPLLKATLDELLGEALIAIEASRLGLAAPSAAELAAAREGLAPASASDQAYRELLGSLSVSASELDEIARRRAVVGAFLAANLEGMLTPGESDLARAYQSEDHPFRDEPLAVVHDRFSAWLAQRRLHEAVGRWVLSLKERTPYRVLASF